MNIGNYLKRGLTLFVVCSIALMLVNSSCTRIKNKITNIFADSGAEADIHIGSLYPELNNVSCLGMKQDGLFYSYWFRYEATPTMVESTLMAHPCVYEEIVPDTILYTCERSYALEKFELASGDSKSLFSEWKNAPQNNLLYYYCTRTPLEHVLVFDTVMGYVYHYISEFSE
ncbi:MAG: hypothetical protein IK005_07480 [Paludibacteraceae bacterium]|nr:hypothetical protein [Paludibacteraceae bacterium]